LPGLIWGGPPGVPTSGKISEVGQACIELHHLTEKDHEPIVLEYVFSVQELPASVISVMRHEHHRRLGSENSLESDDLRLLGIGKSPFPFHRAISM
jgi:hypothetical protein